MPHNLLTFAPADRDAAERLNAQFRQWNLDTELPPDSFSREAVEDCESLVLLVSGQTSASDRVRIELAWALQAKKRILPILIEKTSLLPFPFLVERQNIDYTADSVHVMKRLTSTLNGTLPHPMEPPELPPRSNNTPPDQESIAVDEEMAAALFFAAAELTESAVEQAIFLYNTLLRYAPDYAGGSLNSFISLELERLQPMWLQNLKEGVFEAVKLRNLQHAGHLVREMQALDAGAAATQAAVDQLFQAQLETLTSQIKLAIHRQQWNEAEALIQALATLDTNQNAVMQHQLQAAKIASWETSARAAIQHEHWDDFEKYVNALVPTNPELPDDLRTLSLKVLGELGLTALEAKQHIQSAQIVAQRLQEIDPENAYTVDILARVLKLQIEPALAKGRFAVSSGQWQEASDAAQEALEQAPDDEEALSIQRTAQTWMTANALYEQAVLAVESDQMKVAGLLLRRIQEMRPEYGDPQGLLRGQPLSAAFAGFIGLTARLEAHPRALSALAIANDGSYLVTGSESVAMVWELPTFEPIQAFKAPEWVKEVILSPNNDYLAVLSANREMRVWSLADGKMILQDKSGVGKAAFSPDSKILVAARMSGQPLLSWKLFDPSPISIWIDSQGSITTLALSPNSRDVAVAFGDGKIVLYDISELLQRRKNDEESFAPILPPRTIFWRAASLAFLKGGEQLLGTSLSAKEEVCIWDMDGKILKTFPLPDYNSTSVIAVSPDETFLVTAKRMGGIVTLWDLQTGKSLYRMRTDIRGVPTIAFTPDGLYLVIGDSNGNVTFWGVGGAEKPVVHKGKRG